MRYKLDPNDWQASATKLVTEVRPGDTIVAESQNQRIVIWQMLQVAGKRGVAVDVERYKEEQQT